jgi:aconitate hydratase
MSGARILECACGPCIGMGQSPSTNGVSLRTFNRNFEGRSGTLSAEVYLVSPEVAAVSAINGYLSDPREFELEDYAEIEMPKTFLINDNMIITPVFKSRGSRKSFNKSRGQYHYRSYNAFRCEAPSL